ncbi:hypothetical protein M011DRAFT_467021 [Sporormia fimetaria CBS 119925]|uniref:Uncharacterized protein n=1 Tax=Sporormia fimetaria CBS 119925 TaxID=1340428 RepID=A0A6A6VCU8_9PLEO|nr:hypothetical protein M011DRAFT_467021 [Sporormia fimetaria CBS 119925]
MPIKPESWQDDDPLTAVAALHMGQHTFRRLWHTVVIFTTPNIINISLQPVLMLLLLSFPLN